MREDSDGGYLWWEWRFVRRLMGMGMGMGITGHEPSEMKMRQVSDKPNR